MHQYANGPWGKKAHQWSSIPRQSLGQLKAPDSSEENSFILLHTLHWCHRRWTPKHSKLSETRMEATQAGLHTCRWDMN